MVDKLNKSTSVRHENADNHTEASNKKSGKHELRSWLFSIAAAIVIALMLRFFVFEFVRVDGPSMQPTLYTDEFVLMEKVTYWFRNPERGDVVICSFPDSPDSFVKRVIGVPGDVLEVRNGVLYINEVSDYEYFDGYIDTPPAPNPVTIPGNCVFVMGDNRNHSTDSNDESVGPIPYEKVLGRALFVIWPLAQMHGL